MYRTRAALQFSLVCALVQTSACKGKGPTGPLLVVAPQALDFGAVPVDQESTKTLALRNGGGTNIDLLSVSLSTGDAGSWKVDWPGASTLVPGAQAQVTVTFSPEAQGPAAGELTIRTTLDDPERTAPLSGVGGPSETDDDGDGYSAATGDCDDGRPEVHPGADEICDGLDDDCDGIVPADEADADGDGWRVCEDDCDDADASRHPGAKEVCDDVDNDCDGIVQDRLDEDGDGYSLCDDDCDDGNAARNPGASEVCDFLDNDCNGVIDDLDLDGDGFSTCDSGRDCDDTDPSAHPVLVDASAGSGGDGSADAPFSDLDSALSALDDVCRTVVLREGTYEAELSWSDGPLTLAGGVADPASVVLTTPKGSSAHLLEVSGGASVTLADLTVAGVSASTDGGAIRVVNSELSLSGVTLRDNHSGGDGGALAVSSGSLRMADCTLLDNVAGDDGGAVAVVSSEVDDHGSVYQGNQGARGGAIVWETSTGTLADGSIVGNTASADGGGLWLVGGSGLLLERLDLWQNEAAGVGGALALSDLSDEATVLRNLSVQGNVAGAEGGGIAITGSRSALVLANNDLLANSAVGAGGGLYLGATSATGTWAWSNIVAWNGGNSGVFAVDGGGASVAFTTSYNNTSGVDLDVAAGENGGDNATADPRWTSYDPAGDPADQDLSLRFDSPARDSGPDGSGGPAAVADWTDLDGSRNDRGLTGGQGAAP